jgi:hypothetical protein
MRFAVSLTATLVGPSPTWIVVRIVFVEPSITATESLLKSFTNRRPVAGLAAR